MTFTDGIVACYVPWYTPMENLWWYIPTKLQWKKKGMKKKWHVMPTENIADKINSSLISVYESDDNNSSRYLFNLKRK